MTRIPTFNLGQAQPGSGLPSAQQAPQQQPGAWDLGMMGMMQNMPQYWGYQAMADARPQEAYWGFQGQLANADASRYATDAGLQGLLNRLPWEYAGTVQQSAAAGDAATQVGMYNMLGDIYPAAYQAWSQSTTAPEVAGIQAGASNYQADAGAQAAGYGAWGDMMSGYYPAQASAQAASYGPLNTAIGADAAKYGAQQAGLSNIMSSYYPAASGIGQAQIGAGAADLQSQRMLEGQQVGAQSAENIAQTQAGAGQNIAQTQAGANVDVAGLQAGAGRDIAQTNVMGQLGQTRMESDVARFIAQLQQQMAMQALTSRQGGLQTILDAIMPLMNQGAPTATPLSTSYGAGYG